LHSRTYQRNTIYIGHSFIHCIMLTSQTTSVNSLQTDYMVTQCHAVSELRKHLLGPHALRLRFTWQQTSIKQALSTLVFVSTAYCVKLRVTAVSFNLANDVTDYRRVNDVGVFLPLLLLNWRGSSPWRYVTHSVAGSNSTDIAGQKCCQSSHSA